MFTKKIILALFISANNAFFMQADDNQKPEIVLTMEEVEQLIKEIEKNRQLAKNIVPMIHSKKGLEKMLKCINNFEECEHPSVLGNNNKEHKKSSQLRNAIIDASKLQNGKHPMENVINFLHEDMYERNEYAELKKKLSYDLVKFEEVLRAVTMQFYTYLHGYLQHKKSVNQ